MTLGNNVHKIMEQNKNRRREATQENSNNTNRNTADWSKWPQSDFAGCINGLQNKESYSVEGFKDTEVQKVQKNNNT